MNFSEENPGDSFGNMLSDYIPFMPSGARRAGMAEMLAKRMGTDPGFLVKNPALSQSAAVGAGMLGSGLAGLTGPAALAPPALALLAVQALKRHKIKAIGDQYEEQKRHTRLRDIEGLPDFFADKWYENPSARLGRVLAYEAMKKRKYQDVGPLSEAGDAVVLAGQGTALGLPASMLAGLVDNAEADEHLRKTADAQPRSKHDQRNNTTLPMYLASGAGAGIGGILASIAMVRQMKQGHPIPRSEWQGLVDSVAQRHVPVREVSGLNNAFYSPGSDSIAVGSDFGLAPIIAHEAGHARAQTDPGLLGTLARYGYPASSIISPLSGAGSLAAGLALKNPWLGALAGTAIGGLSGAGVIVPEARASWQGMEGLQNYRNGSLASPGDKKMLGSALATYLAAMVLPSTLAGAAGGYVGKKRKQEADALTPASDV